MITRRDLLKTAGAGAALPLTSAAQTPDPSTVIWYDKPAATWNDALPVGNGHLGAMVFGRVEKERIQLNEHSLWSGRPNPDDDQPQTFEALPEVRRLLFEGNYAEANKLAQAKMMKPMNNETFGSYQTLGDLTLELDHPAGEVTGYRRQLDLNTGVSTVTYQLPGASYSRQIFCSYPDRVLVVHLETTAPEGLHVRAALSRERDATVQPDGPYQSVTGQPKPFGVEFAAHLHSDYKPGANSATFIISAATSFAQPDPAAQSRAAIAKAAARSYSELVHTHTTDHQSLFHRVSLRIDAPKPLPSQPTDARLAAVRAGADDPSFAALYFNFGRYLLISCSRTGSLPSNLQGLWADGTRPPWSADYHININIQMNY